MRGKKIIDILLAKEKNGESHGNNNENILKYKETISNKNQNKKRYYNERFNNSKT